MSTVAKPVVTVAKPAVAAPPKVVEAPKKPIVPAIPRSLVPYAYHLTHASLGALVTLSTELICHPFLNIGKAAPLYRNFSSVLPNVGVQFYYHAAYEFIRKNLVATTLVPPSVATNPFFLGPTAAVLLEASKTVWHIPLTNMSRKDRKGWFDGWKQSFFPTMPFLATWFTGAELSNKYVPKIVAPRAPMYRDHFVGSLAAAAVAVTVAAPARTLIRFAMAPPKKTFAEIHKEEKANWLMGLRRTVPRLATRRVSYMVAKKFAYAALQPLIGQ